MLSDDEMNVLVEDIRVNGLRHPLVVDKQNRLLDGRNRFRACAMLGITPTFERYEGDDPTRYIISVNVHRRHLTKQAQAIVIARIYARKGRWEQEIRRIAGWAGVSRDWLTRAGYVVLHAPDLADAVLTNQMGLKTAYRDAHRREGQPLASDKPEIPVTRLPEAQRATQIRALAGRGQRASQIAVSLGITKATVQKIAHRNGITLPAYKQRDIDPNVVMEQTAAGLEVTVMALEMIATMRVDPDEVDDWIARIENTLPRIRRLISDRKESMQHAQGD